MTKKQIVEEFVKRVDPYKKPKSPVFDLRGYAAWIEKHKLAKSDITQEATNEFTKYRKE